LPILASYPLELPSFFEPKQEIINIYVLVHGLSRKSRVIVNI